MLQRQRAPRLLAAVLALAALAAAQPATAPATVGGGPGPHAVRAAS